MQPNNEYCDGQAFDMVFVTGNNFIWQCRKCAYGLLQPLDEEGDPQIPRYHPKPVPVRFEAIDRDAMEDRLSEL